MNPFKQKLIDLGACVPALDWVGDRTLEEAWAECENLDWLEWVVCRLDLPKTEFVNLACRAARSVLHLIPEGEDRPRLAIEAAEKWLVKPTEKNRNASYPAADYAAYRPAAAAYRAAYHVAYVAYSAAYHAASAAYTAYATSAARAAASAAYAAAHALCETKTKACDKFREFYPVELVKRGLGL